MLVYRIWQHIKKSSIMTPGMGGIVPRPWLWVQVDEQTHETETDLNLDYKAGDRQMPFSSSWEAPQLPKYRGSFVIHPQVMNSHHRRSKVCVGHLTHRSCSLYFPPIIYTILVVWAHWQLMHTTKEAYPMTPVYLNSAVSKETVFGRPRSLSGRLASAQAWHQLSLYSQKDYFTLENLSLWFVN